MDSTVQIHLSKPGGRMEGPFTLEQIRRDLASKKYRDSDYWAWHTGLPEWLPLYELPGITGPEAPSLPTPSPVAPVTLSASGGSISQDTPSPVAAPMSKAVVEASVAAPMSKASVEVSVAAPAKPEQESPASEVEEEPVPLHRQLSSGMPFSSLEQIFIFTTGEGPRVWESDAAVRMFHAVIGEELGTIRAYTPRDVVSNCDLNDLLGRDGTLSDSVWRAMSTRQSQLVQQARDGVHRICVRTFRIEDDSVVAMVLFYNKQKL